MRLLVFLLPFLCACQSLVYGTASELNSLSLGMSKGEVIKKLGSPVAIHADADTGEEQLIFKKMKHTISSWPRTYQVTLRNGKVVKWGEQYNEQNVNEY